MNFKPLRTTQVDCPEWSDTPITLREPRVRDYLASKDITDQQEKAISLLSASVLDEQGNPIGREVLLDAPLSALNALSNALTEFVTSEVAGPLAMTSGLGSG